MNMKSSRIETKLRLMANRNVPYVLVEGAIDEVATVRSIIKTLGIQEERPPDREVLYVWECVTGLSVAGESPDFTLGEELLKRVKARPSELDTTSPLQAIKALVNVADSLSKENASGGRVAAVFFTGDRVLSEKNDDGIETMQLLLNAREQLKYSQVMLVFVGISFNLPPELKEHVQFLTAPLPDKDEIDEVLDNAMSSYEANFDAKQGIDKFVMTDDLRLACRDALRGMSRFQAEQTVYLSMDMAGIHLDRLRENAIHTINQQKGLSVQPSGGGGFDKLGGLDSIKTYLRQLKGSPKFPVKLVLFVDEIEKAVAGSGGQDTSGVSTNMLGSILTDMQESKAFGMMLTGVYGCGKSAIAKAFGEELGAITIHMDISGMKDSLVGSSETNLRNALKTVRSIGGDDGGIMWIATCNRIDQLPPELKRRFNLGTYFFALPSDAERAAIWDIYTKRYGIEQQPVTFDDGWTGAEIESCCRMADLLGCSLAEAATRITPVAVTAADEIEKLCLQAEGRFLCATNGGTYKRNTRQPKPSSSKGGAARLSL